jgi:small-conductance mechanosensitive channel
MRGMSHHLGKKRLPLAIWIQLCSLLMVVHDRIRSRGRLKHASTAVRSPIDGISQAYALGGRLLILLTAILIFVMPWTEYFWQFDRFLFGGQDFELGLLSLLTIFSLVLVLLQQRRQNVTLLLTVRRWLSLVFEDADPRAVAKACSLTAHSDAVPLSSRALCRYNLPIQV